MCVEGMVGCVCGGDGRMCVEGMVGCVCGGDGRMCVWRGW